MNRENDSLIYLYSSFLFGSSNYTIRSNYQQISDNEVEIQTDLQTELIPITDLSRNVDYRFTAPPLRQLELITSMGKNFVENDKKNRKQSILLNGWAKKFKNEKNMLPENLEGITFRENDKLTGSESRPSIEFWTEYIQTPKKSEYGRNEGKSVAINRPKIFLRNENQRYEEQAKLVNSRKAAKPIYSIHEAEDGNDDSGLMMNSESNYRDLLIPEPAIQPNTMQFINGISKHMKYDNHKQTGNLNFNSRNLCPIDDVINSQPWNSMSVVAQSEKIRTPEYQIPKLSSSRWSPVSASLYELNNQQNENPATWDTVANQFLTPITPVNNRFNNSIQVNPPSLYNPWMRKRATTINQSWLNDIKIPARPISTGYTESFQPAVPLSPATSVPQTNPFFKEFNVYNRSPPLTTLRTMNSNYYKTDTEIADHNNKKQQKDSRTYFEKEYPINRELKTSATMIDLMENWRHPIPASESLISS